MHVLLQCPKLNDDWLEFFTYILQNNIQSIQDSLNKTKLFIEILTCLDTGVMQALGKFCSKNHQKQAWPGWHINNWNKSYMNLVICILIENRMVDRSVRKYSLSCDPSCITWDWDAAPVTMREVCPRAPVNHMVFFLCHGLIKFKYIN